MSPLEPNIEYERYYAYQNRIASFSRWPLNWDIDNEKPTPEVLARAGFFHYKEAPCLDDNVICPFCLIFLDEWDPNDDPMHEHRVRSPNCSFVVGQPPVDKMHNNHEPHPTQDTLRRDDKAPSNQAPPGNDKPQKGQKPQAHNSRQTKPSKKRAAPVSKAKETATKADKRRKQHGE